MYRILLVSDREDEDCRIREYLALSGFSVEETACVSVAEYEKKVWRSDLILLYFRKVETTFHQCEILRKITDIPIVVITRYNDEWTKIKLFQLGADDYIEEPFQSGEVVARLGARMRQFQRLTRTVGVIQTRKLMIDVWNRQVFMDRKEVNLTIREYDILLYLAQRPNEVVSKEELYQAMWSEQYLDSGYNGVASYIKKIRRKIEPIEGRTEYIETIWGIGYRFIK